MDSPTAAAVAAAFLFPTDSAVAAAFLFPTDSAVARALLFLADSSPAPPLPTLSDELPSYSGSSASHSVTSARSCVSDSAQRRRRPVNPLRVLSVVPSLRRIDPKVLAKTTSKLFQGEAAKRRKGVWIDIYDEDEDEGSERSSPVASEGSTVTGAASAGSTATSGRRPPRASEGGDSLLQRANSIMHWLSWPKAVPAVETAILIAVGDNAVTSKALRWLMKQQSGLRRAGTGGRADPFVYTALNNIEEPRDDNGRAIRYEKNGRKLGFSMPNTDNRIWTRIIEDLGLTNMNSLLDLQGEWHFLPAGGNTLEPCMLQGNLQRSRKRIFQPYDRSVRNYESQYGVQDILSVWGPLVLIQKNNEIYLHNLQSLYLRKIWEPVFQISWVTACCLDYGRIVLTGIKHDDEENLLICERYFEVDHQWSVARYEYGDSVISLLAAGSHTFWISDEYELYSIERDENDEPFIQSYDLEDQITAPVQQMSLLWADGNLLLVELKQVPVAWKVSWDTDRNVCYEKLSNLLGYNAFIIPGMSGFILPAAAGALGNKMFVGNDSSTDCYVYSMTERFFEDLMPCESYSAHSSCDARWVALRGAVLQEDHLREP